MKLSVKIVIQCLLLSIHKNFCPYYPPPKIFFKAEPIRAHIFSLSCLFYSKIVGQKLAQRPPLLNWVTPDKSWISLLSSVSVQSLFTSITVSNEINRDEVPRCFVKNYQDPVVRNNGKRRHLRKNQCPLTLVSPSTISLWIGVFQIAKSVVDLGGRDSVSIHFNAVFGQKLCQIIGWRSLLWEILDPPLQIPGYLLNYIPGEMSKVPTKIQ